MPAQGAALWVGHHGQVSPVPGAEPSYAPRRAVRVQGVLFSGTTLVVKVTERGQMTGNNLLLGLGVPELHKTWVGQKKKRGFGKSILKAAAVRRREHGALRLMIHHEATVVQATILQSDLCFFNDDSISNSHSD